MLRDVPVILWHLADGRPPEDDAHHMAAGVHAAADFLSVRPGEVYRAIREGEDVDGWYLDFADPRQVGRELARAG